MPFHYDHENLGYEVGYSETLKNKKPSLSSQEVKFGDCPEGRGGYRCDDPPSGVTVARPAPRPASSDGIAGPAGPTGVPSEVPTPAEPKKDDDVDPKKAKHLVGSRTPAPINPDKPAYLPNENRLRNILEAGPYHLNRDEIGMFFITHFPVLDSKNEKSREAAIADYLPGGKKDVTKKESPLKDPEGVRQAIANKLLTKVKDKCAEIKESKKPALSADEGTAYQDSLGILNGTNAVFAKNSAGGPDSKRMKHAVDQVYSKDFPKTKEKIVKRTQINYAILQARDAFRTNNVGSGKGLAFESAAQADVFFNQMLARAGLTDKNGFAKYENWGDLSSTDPQSPIQLLFKLKTPPATGPGPIPFDAKTGKVDTTAEPQVFTSAEIAIIQRGMKEEKLGKEDLAKIKSPLLQALVDSAQASYQRNVFFYVLTGKEFDPNNPVAKKLPPNRYADKSGLDLEDEKSTEDPNVLDPPLTRAEALAYLQSQGLIDEEGLPVPGKKADDFSDLLSTIQRGDELPSHMLYQTSAWERKELYGLLSKKPHALTDQKIERLFQENHWFSNGANISAMEKFRQRLLKGENLEQTRQEIAAADDSKNDIVTSEEKDRALLMHEARKSEKPADEPASVKGGGGGGSGSGDDEEEDKQIQASRDRNATDERISAANRTSQEKLKREEIAAQAREGAASRELQREVENKKLAQGERQIRIQARQKDRELALQKEGHKVSREGQEIQKEDIKQRRETADADRAERWKEANLNASMQFLGSLFAQWAQIAGAELGKEGQLAASAQGAILQGFPRGRS